MADVIEEVWRSGGRLDAWTDYFSFDRWMRAFEQCGVDAAFYANREFSTDELLPWDHLDAGVTKAFLRREWEKAQRAERTQDCRKGCVGCGMNRYEGACDK